MFIWGYAIESRVIVHNSVPRTLFQAQGKKPHECTFGDQSDISNFFNFGWHGWMYYRYFGSFPENK